MSDDAIGLDPYEAVLADLQRRRDEIDHAIKVVQSVRGAGAAATGKATVAETPTTDTNESGQFLGLSIAEAAKKLLSIKRRTMNSAEIAAGLQSGGVPMSPSDPANTIGSILTRRFNHTGDIVRVSRGQWGLPEWYPHTKFRPKSDAGRDLLRPNTRSDNTKLTDTDELTTALDNQDGEESQPERLKA